MRRIPANLRREIKLANKKANKLRRANGYPAISKINDYNFTNIEVKISAEDFEKGNVDLSSFKEYAYFYNREDQLMGAEKIKNGKLKEYYDKPTYFKYNIDDFDTMNIISNKDCVIETLNGYFATYGIPEVGFKINGNNYTKEYYSFNAETNELEDIYFYREKDSATSDIIKTSKYLSDRNKDIIRVDNRTHKVNKIYLQALKPDLQAQGLGNPEYCFYYFSPDQRLEAVLVKIT